MKVSNSFTEGKILSPLIRFAFPVLLALFLQAMYGAIDLAIVGKFAATTDISAVSTGSQLMHTLTCVLVGLAMGITVLLGRKIGEGNAEEGGDVIGTGIWLFAILAASLTVVLMLLTEPLCRLLQAPQEAFEATVNYVRICSAGTIFIIAFNVLGSIFRGIGDSRMPLFSVGVACVANIAGDFLLVAVMQLGASGAAIATVLSQALSVVISLYVISKRTLPFLFSRQKIRFRRPIVGSILRIGIPMALQDLLVSISFLVILAIVNSLGLVKSAGVGVAEKICAFIMLVPSAYMQSMSAFVAQNMGAGKPERAKQALFYGIATSLAAGVVVGYISFFHGDLLSMIFAKQPEVIAASASYLRSYAIDCLFTSFLFCFVGYFSGMEKTVFVMIQGVISAFCVRVPFSYFISRIPDASLFYIGLATPASTLVQIVMCVFYFVSLGRRERLASPADPNAYCE